MEEGVLSDAAGIGSISATPSFHDQQRWGRKSPAAGGTGLRNRSPEDKTHEYDEMSRKRQSGAAPFLPPRFLNRVDAVLIFHALSKEKRCGRSWTWRSRKCRPGCRRRAVLSPQ
jgi:hypothetical protein